MRFASHVEQIAPFHVMRLLAEARSREQQGELICHLEVGEPDFASAEPILQAGIAALQKQQTHYTAASGLDELRRAISDWYAQRFCLQIEPQRILVTPGASGALQLLIGLLLDPDDEILLTDPGYPCNRHLALLAGARPVTIAVDENSGFQPTPAQIRQHWNPGKTRALLLATPSNPTGSVIGKAELSAIHATVRELGGVLLVDEIYQGLSYDIEAFSALELGDDVFVINSFSKYFGMTGWRVGWLVAPLQAIEPLNRLAQNLYLAAPTPSQHAAVAAFSPAALATHVARRDEFARRRDYLHAALSQLGFQIRAEPQGAFYLYCNCSNLTADSTALVQRMLDQAGVAATPGVDFGQHRAHEHLRFAYTRSIETMRAGMLRLQTLLSDRV